ncbi:NADH-quinone oxidoreductase subunit N [Dehalogenimonas formicexedens]|uniref:NADH-quinone oxidoreductase subunit N n=1 Tax=Dehalogenimonas formicexedens TaxID=1839801 RepID=A0A1P8F6I6_9CHLR|nr:NADH-quinone oxidoreductase subunit N [Dehalogenimonas formicexedens]APV44097.1 NADH-quinone oxidoreductase subunit N [Dehalogenimonas formicexedens]
MNYSLLAPEFIVLGTAVAVILVDLFASNKKTLVGLSVAGLIASIVVAAFQWPSTPQSLFGGMIAHDSLAGFFKIFFPIMAGLVVLASADYVENFKKFQGEYHALVLLAALGMMLIAQSSNLITLYLSLEITAVSFYVLVGIQKDKKSTESALKYVLLSGVASAVLVYGMALVFGFTGFTGLSEIAGALQSMPPSHILGSPGLLMGLIFVIAGLGFKIAAVPFQFWVPDVYEGAPTPITMYLSVASKAAGFALVIRVLSSAFIEPSALANQWAPVVAVIAAIGMTAGNLMAIPQRNIKRLLGYSTIAHAGYMLVGLAALGSQPSNSSLAIGSVLFYLICFAVSDLAAFICIIAVSRQLKSDDFPAYAGLARTSPIIAGALTLALLSLTGFPPTAGFLAKFYVFNAGVQADLLWLVVIAAINTVISAYYYFGVIKVLWLRAPAAPATVPASNPLKTALAISTIGILILGIVPAAALKLSEAAAAIFVP